MAAMKGQTQHNAPGAAGAPAIAVARGRRGRALRVGALAAGAVLCLFGAGFAVFASHVGGLTTPENPAPADAIIVLTGGQSRIDAAVDLLRSGKGKRLLISGVNPVARRADLSAATGGNSGLFNCCIDIDHLALDTVGNAEESAKWVREHAFGSVILVTNNYHMPRSLLEMRRLLGDAEMTPYPVVNTPLDGGGWLTKPQAIRVIFTEYTKYLAALARNTLTDPATGDAVAVVRTKAP